MDQDNGIRRQEDRGIKICVDLRKFIDVYLHDSFHTPFTYDVMKNVGFKRLTRLHMEY
jgi:hypothetical protein